MARIDSHQHFWKFDSRRDSWISEEMAAIGRDFMPEDLEPILKQHHFDGCVVIQSAQSEDENDFQLDHAKNNSFVKGIIGWVDLRSAALEETLQEYKNVPLIKGFRHILQGETNRACMLEPDFIKGLDLLGKYNYTYDVLIFSDQLVFLEKFLKMNTANPLVINHLAKPNIRSLNLSEWSKGIQQVAKFENVYCKVSGLVTEADWLNWQYEDFLNCLDITFNAFGPDRLMFGSDWPVCNLAGGYDKVLEITQRYTSSLTQTEQSGFWGDNAVRFYNLAK
jgi:L-fuconolactonase